MLQLLTSPTIRRLFVTLAGSAVVVLNKKFGLNLDTTDILSIAGLVISYVTGSNLNDIVTKRAVDAGNAAAATVTPDNAKQTINDAIAAEKDQKK